MKKIWSMTVTVAVTLLLGVGLAGCSETHIHAYGQWTVTTPATCVDFGEMTRVCECGVIETIPIAPTGIHAYGD